MNVGDVNYYTHSSKTRCVFVDNKEMPLISIDIWCKAGSSFEDVGKNGTAHFLEHMIFKGSNKIMPGEFDDKIESLGGISNASTGYDDVHYHVLIPPNNFRESLALLTNIVVSPNFNPDEFIKEKGVVIDEIKQQNDQPEERLFNYFLKRVWLNHYYSNSILGTEDSIKNLGINDLKKFHKKYPGMAGWRQEQIDLIKKGNAPVLIFTHPLDPYEGLTSDWMDDVPNFKRIVVSEKKTINGKKCKIAGSNWEEPLKDAHIIDFADCFMHYHKLIKEYISSRL